ncbi:MAG: 4Fe-4S dicluster domain-containing protein [Gammaproteobacteria bacterium]|nr:4Fe-4S dicluster domain-containing protein [Gammaproteobacteria bacterium]
MRYFLPQQKLNTLLLILRDLGYTCIGPQVQNGAVIYDELNDAKQLPWGIQAVQTPGKYELIQTDLKEAFAWANGPQALKPLLFKPKESLWKVERDPQGKLLFKEAKSNTNPIAFIGARSCDLAGLAVQDKTFVQGEYKDKRYQSQRDNLFMIAVNCGYSGGNCFCVSTNTGPKASSGFDLAFTEITDGFLIEVGTERGEKIIQQLQCEKASDEKNEHAHNNIERAAKMQSKRMPKNNTRLLRDILMNNLEHERWDNVAERCLSCGNCTSVCPTCFCHHETETATLDGSSSEHEREWDSCFSTGHSVMHGRVIRDDTKKQYKQWLTHKLGTWWDQFDTSGCIGCGRCVTWCPVGIDITEEMAAISGESNIIAKPHNDKEK